MNDHGELGHEPVSKSKIKCDVQRSEAAERMRLTRQRRRAGMRVIPFVIRDEEITVLVARGLLDPIARNDRSAVARALGKLLDTVPPERWPLPAAR